MIIMASTPLNHKTAETLQRQFPYLEPQAYPTVKLQDIIGSTLYIIDLEGDGSFQTLYKPKLLAQFLLDSGLPETITTLCLIVSDVAKKRLLSFANDLILAFLSEGRDIIVQFSSDLNYQSIIITPPNSPTEFWVITGIKNSNKGPHSTKAFFSSTLKKDILWEGHDITEWFALADNTLDKSQCILENFNPSLS